MLVVTIKAWLHIVNTHAHIFTFWGNCLIFIYWNINRNTSEWIFTYGHLMREHCIDLLYHNHVVHLQNTVTVVREHSVSNNTAYKNTCFDSNGFHHHLVHLEYHCWTFLFLIYTSETTSNGSTFRRKKIGSNRKLSSNHLL